MPKASRLAIAPNLTEALRDTVYAVGSSSRTALKRFTPLTPEQAVEIACLLVDEGCTVSGIGWGSLTVTVGKSEIAHLFAHWKRAKADRC